MVQDGDAAALRPAGERTYHGPTDEDDDDVSIDRVQSVSNDPL